MGDNLEREVKLGAWPGFELPELDGVVEGVTTGTLPRRVLDATYYDTADLRLARWGCSLRYRSGDGTGWTVKLPDEGGGVTMVRRELTFDGPPSLIPTDAARLVMAYSRTEPLAPMARLRTVRTGVELRDAEGQRVAEVTDDEVSVLEGRRVAARFREVEAEILDRAPDGLLEAVVECLREAGAGAPEKISKSVRAMGARATAPPELVVPELGDDATVAAVLRAAMISSVIRVLTHDAGVRLGDDPEDVHQARVGTRRLRSDLRTFRALLDEAWSEPLRDDLRWIAGLLGAVRDADVLLERLRRQAAELPSRDLHGVAALVRRLHRERDDARATLLEAMSTPRYLGLLERMVVAADAPHTRPEADKRADEVLPDLVLRPWKHLEKAVGALDDEPPDDGLHEVRIRAKRTRYAAEAAAPVIGKPAKALASAVADVQTVLGDHHDAVVAEGWLRDAVSRAGSAQALVAGELIAVQRSEAAAARAAWGRAWKQASRKKLRSWLS
jgi:CHAD domain-containing protein